MPVWTFCFFTVIKTVLRYFKNLLIFSCYILPWAAVLLLLSSSRIQNSLLLYSALSVALSTESKVVLSDMGREFHIWRVLLNESSWMIMHSRALHERVSRTDLSLYKQAERINSSQRFWNRSNKPLFKPYIHLHTVSHLQTLTSAKKVFSFCKLFFVCLCLGGCLKICLHLFYVCTHF